MWQQVKREYKIEDSLYAEATASHPEKEKSQTRYHNVPNTPSPIQIFLTVNPTKYTAQGPEYPRNKQHSSPILNTECISDLQRFEIPVSFPPFGFYEISTPVMHIMLTMANIV